MPYRYTTFNGINLPPAMPEEDLSTPSVPSTLVDSLAGSFNYLGRNRYYPKSHPIRYTGLYVGQIVYWVDEAGNRMVDEAGNYLIMAADEAAHLRSQVDAIKAQIGRWAELLRRREEDGAEQFKMAKLLAANHVRTLRDVDRVAKLDLALEAEGRPWRAATATTVSASLAANTGTYVAVGSAGEEEIRDAVLRITATSTITAVTVAYGQHTFTWTGTLAAGASLLIDCGALTVTNAGADAYSGFTLNSGHAATGWLTLDPATTTNLLVTLAGGGGTIDIEYYDQWA